MSWWPIPLLAALVATTQPAAAPTDRWAQERELMVLTAANMAEVAGVRRFEPAVLRAMRAVPRHLLVPAPQQRRAYENEALPIGYGATISQPSVVLMMTQLLETEPDHVVLEVGTGSGYQAAILSRLVRHVYSIEIIAPLARRAASSLARLGYGNVTIRAGDGYAGWAEHAPFDRIIVTAGTDHVPQPLLDQLRPGGVMVLPLGRSSATLQLTVIRKDENGRISRRRITPVRFVPLTRTQRAD